MKLNLNLSKENDKQFVKITTKTCIKLQKLKMQFLVYCQQFTFHHWAHEIVKMSNIATERKCRIEKVAPEGRNFLIENIHSSYQCSLGGGEESDSYCNVIDIVKFNECTSKEREMT